MFLSCFKTRYATVSTTNGNTLVGETRLQIPTSGQLSFTDIGLSDVASGVILRFAIETEPPSSYNSLNTTSNGIEVAQRQFYLAVAEDVAADLALPFSLAVEVRDVGTRVKALPWKTPMTLTVALTTNPTGAAFSGTLTVNVTDAIGNFTDLEINKLGTNYVVEVTSSDGHKVKIIHH